MAKSLKRKVTEVLRAAVGSDAEVEFEDTPDGKIIGRLRSRRFARQSPTARQDLVWKHLDAHLTRAERARVVFIVTDTPAEHEALKRAAG